MSNDKENGRTVFTTIPVKPSTKKRLQSLFLPMESWDALLNRMADITEQHGGNA